jgi:hypothetical protein
VNAFLRMCHSFKQYTFCCCYRCWV